MLVGISLLASTTSLAGVGAATQCCQRLATAATFLGKELCCQGAMTRKWVPQTRYTLRRNTASIIKDLIHFGYVAAKAPIGLLILLPPIYHTRQRLHYLYCPVCTDVKLERCEFIITGLSYRKFLFVILLILTQTLNPKLTPNLTLTQTLAQTLGLDP